MRFFFFFSGYGQISTFGSVGATGSVPAVVLARGTGMAGDMSLGDLILLTRSVRAIVGNHVSPDLALIRYASTQGGPPTRLSDMIPYLGLMLEMVKMKGIQMPDGSIQQIVPESSIRGLHKGVTRKQVVKLMSKSSIEMRVLEHFFNA